MFKEGVAAADPASQFAQLMQSGKCNFPAICPYQVKGLSIPAKETPVNAEASSDIALKSSTSRLWTDDFPHALASSVISIVIAVKKPGDSLRARPPRRAFLPGEAPAS